MCIGNVSERSAVDAVPNAIRRFRGVLKHMSKMRIACAASYLGSHHSMGGVHQLYNGRLLDRLGECGPAAAAFKLVGGREQRLAGNDVHINTLLKLIPEFVSERILRTAFLRDIILLCRQFVTDGLFSGFLIIVGINAKGREQFDLFSGNMAIA